MISLWTDLTWRLIASVTKTSSGDTLVTFADGTTIEIAQDCTINANGDYLVWEEDK